MLAKQEQLRRKMWNSIFNTVPQSLRHIPSMLTREELAMLYWLTRYYVSGKGQIVDLGSFVGGSTAYLAHGLIESKSNMKTIKVHAYDRFKCAEHMKEKLLYSKGIEAFAGDDILWLSNKLLSDYSDVVNFVQGDVLKAKWGHGAIEILFVDVAKSYALNEHIVRTFFPHLIEGHSIVVQQDYLHYRTPWIIATMELMSDCFELVGWTEQFSAVFLCKKTPSDDIIAQISSECLTEQRMEAAMTKAISRFPYQRQKEIVAHALFIYKKQSHVQESWRFRSVNVSEDEIRALADTE